MGEGFQVYGLGAAATMWAKAPTAAADWKADRIVNEAGGMESKRKAFLRTRG